MAELNEKNVSMENKKLVKNKKSTHIKKSAKNLNKENVLPSQKTFGANQKQFLWTPNKSVDYKTNLSPALTTRSNAQHKLNENLDLLHSPAVSVVPYFKKTPMPINSPNLQRTKHLPTNKITVTKSENFGMSSWSSHTPDKRVLPKPPAHWIQKESAGSLSPGLEGDCTMSTPARLSPCPRSPCMSSTCSQSSSPILLSAIHTPSSKSSPTFSSKSSVPLSSTKHFKFSRVSPNSKTRNISSDLDNIECDTSVDSDESNLEDTHRVNTKVFDRRNSQDSGFGSEKEDVENQSKEEGENRPNLLLMAILNSLEEDSVKMDKPVNEENQELSAILNSLEKDSVKMERPISEENSELSAILSSIVEDSVTSDNPVNDEHKDLSTILSSIVEESVTSDNPVNDGHKDLSTILSSIVEESVTSDNPVNDEHKDLSAILNSLMEAPVTMDMPLNEENKELSAILSSFVKVSVTSDSLVNEDKDLSTILNSLVKDCVPIDKPVNEEHKDLSAILNSLMEGLCNK